MYSSTLAQMTGSATGSPTSGIPLRLNGAVPRRSRSNRFGPGSLMAKSRVRRGRRKVSRMPRCLGRDIWYVSAAEIHCVPVFDHDAGFQVPYDQPKAALALV